MDIRQSSNYSKYMESLGWLVEKAGETKIFVRHLPVFSRWSVIKVQRSNELDFNLLDEIVKRHHALFVKIEPDLEFKIQDLRFRRDSWPLLPSKTLILDLKNTTLESLPKDTRYEIRKAQKRRLLVKKSSSANDIELFYRLLEETMKIGKWKIPIHSEVVSLWKSFQPNNSQLLFAFFGGVPVAACLLIWEGNTAHYMYAALNNEGRKMGAAYFLLWNVIEFLKERKVSELDLEGIYDERYAKNTKNWIGFTKFKMGWNGREVEYCGSYTKYYNMAIKILFSIFP